MIYGTYYGIITQLDKDAFTVIDLPVFYCRSRYKDIYGNDIVEFNLTYFDRIADPTTREDTLAVYPKIIRKAYNKWVAGKLTTPWYILPGDVGVCFQFFDGIPNFLVLLPAICDYEEAIDNGNERAAEEIKKIIVQHMPHLTDGRLLFEPVEAKEIHDATVGMMRNNKNVSVLTTYGDITTIQSEGTTDATKNSIMKQMLQNIYSAGGVSSELFAATGSATLPESINQDTAIMMTLANKFSDFVTWVLNSLYSNTNISFKYTILPVSYYNTTDYIADSFKLASSGYSFILPALAMGVSQKDLVNIKDLENNVLQLSEKLIPLSSSYTTSGADEGGRPTKDQEDKAEQTIANQDSQDHIVGGSE